jgi:hypothetical protein
MSLAAIPRLTALAITSPAEAELAEELDELQQAMLPFTQAT